MRTETMLACAIAAWRAVTKTVAACRVAPFTPILSMSRAARGIATLAKIAMMLVTMSSSISVAPRREVSGIRMRHDGDGALTARHRPDAPVSKTAHLAAGDSVPTLRLHSPGDSLVRRFRSLLFAVTMLAALSACPASPADVNTAQQLVDIADAMNALRNDNAILQDQVDSLRAATARQDTIIARLAAQAGVSITGP